MDDGQPREAGPAKVLVVCPSRGRPEALVRMIRTALATSTRAHVGVYLDNDDAARYRGPLQEAGWDPRYTHPDRSQLVEDGGDPDSRVVVLVDKPRGPVCAVNDVVRWLGKGYEFFGCVPDDCTFMSPGWDQFLIDSISGFPNRIGVLAAWHGNGDYVNFPWVSRQWIETIGFLHMPSAYHSCCDTALELLGDASHIQYARRDQFAFDHATEPSINAGRLNDDILQFLTWCVGPRREAVQKLREAMKR